MTGTGKSKRPKTGQGATRTGGEEGMRSGCSTVGSFFGGDKHVLEPDARNEFTVNSMNILKTILKG